MMWVMLPFLLTPVVGLLSISLFTAFSVSDCSVMGHLCIIHYDIARLLVTILNQIFLCIVRLFLPGRMESFPEGLRYFVWLTPPQGMPMSVFPIMSIHLSIHVDWGVLGIVPTSFNGFCPSGVILSCTLFLIMEFVFSPLSF